MLGACSHNPFKPEQLVKLNSNPGITNVKDMVAIKIPFDDDTDFEITEKSTVMVFETANGDFKKSYSAFLELPEFQPDSRVIIKSFCACGTGGGGGVFVPSMAVFDKDYNQVERFLFSVGHRDAYPHMVLSFTFQKNFKYVVIYSNPDLYGKPAPKQQIHQSFKSKSYETKQGMYGSREVETTKTFSGYGELDWYSNITGELEIEVVKK